MNVRQGQASEVVGAPSAMVVAPDYPPTNRISSLRAYYLAHALDEAGYRVLVLAESPSSPDSTLPRPEGTVEVRRMRFPHRALWLARALLQVVGMRWHRTMPDVVVTTSGPVLSHAVGALVRMLRPDSFWVADYRDLWSTGKYYTDTPAPWDRIRRLVERHLLAKADMVTTVSDGLARNLSEFHGRDVLVFHNGYESDAATEPPAPRSPGPIRIAHTGFMYRERSPVGLLEIVRDLQLAGGAGPGVQVILAGQADEATSRVLAEFAECPAIRYIGIVSRADAYRLQRESDYCLLLEDPGASRKGVLTGKVFEYIGMRRPIIAHGIATDSEIAGILRESGLLAFCDTSTSALRAFLSTLALGGGVRPPTKPNDAFIAKFDRRSISRALVQEIDRRRKR